jgi:hypothetical protein
VFNKMQDALLKAGMITKESIEEAARREAQEQAEVEKVAAALRAKVDALKKREYEEKMAWTLYEEE